MKQSANVLALVREEFDLREAVRAVIADGVGPNPKDVAVKVLERIPVGLERDLLATLLPEFCRKMLLSTRSARHKRSARAGRVRGAGLMSAKWKAVREEVLNEAWSVNGEWITFGDLTAANLRWLVAERKQAVESLALEATRLANLLALAERHAVGSVRELPFDVIEKVMS